MIYEIINPSDAYTLIADDLEVAAVAVSLLGEGQYALKDTETGETTVPLFMFGNSADTWFQETFHRSFDASITHIIAEKSPELLAVLESVLIGDAKDRRAFERTRDGMATAEERQKFSAAWHDQKRSSMNDIGARARAYAAGVRKKRQEREEEKP